MKSMQRKKGQMLIELLVAIGLSVIIIPAMLTGFVSTREGRAQQVQRLDGTAYIIEAKTALRNIREKGWSNIATNGTYHPVVSGSTWALASGSETINGFTRTIEVSSVYRDVSGNIASSGSLDPSTKKAVITISWDTPRFSSISSTVYITRYLGNVNKIETTQTEFNAGTKVDTVVTNTNGGEVTLAAGGLGDWCAPNLSIAATDLPRQGVADAITAQEGSAFVGTGENSSGVSFANIAISNTNPPVATVSGTFDGYKTNGVFGETNYAYIATDTEKKDIVIIDLTHKDANNKYSEIGFFDATKAKRDKKAKALWVNNNVGYVILNDYLYNFDLSSKSGSRPILDSNGIKLAGEGTRVVVVGNYAYVTVKKDKYEMQIIDISNPSAMVLKGQTDLGTSDARDIFVNPSGTRAYIVTPKSDTKQEFWIVDVSTKTGNRPVLGKYDTGTMSPRALTVVTNNKALIVGTNGEEYQVVDISNEAAPVRCGGLDFGSKDAYKVNGISSVLEADSDAYSYFMTGDPDAEFKIVEGGPGGTKFATSGTFESNPFDGGQDVAFNTVQYSTNVPANTTFRLQVAIASAVSGSCAGASYSYLGPDGTGSTYYTSGDPIYLGTSGSYMNPGRCMRFKAYLTTSDLLASPNLNDVTINYSP